jgi:hypothetical protein
MLNGEQTQEQGIYPQRYPEGSDGTGIDGLRDPEVADESDGIQKDAQEEDVGYNAVKKNE